MMEVQNTVLEVRSEIEGQKSLALPLIKVLDEDGAEVWINATHVRMIKAAGRDHVGSRRARPDYCLRPPRAAWSMG
jgi:hypothetical protein